jgi:hypothetical protein
MLRVDGDTRQARLAAARAHGVPAWVVEQPATHVHRADCYGTLEHSNELLCGYDTPRSAEKANA